MPAGWPCMPDFEDNSDGISKANVTWGICMWQCLAPIDPSDHYLELQLPQNHHLWSPWILAHKASTKSIVALEAEIQGNFGWHLQGNWSPRIWPRDQAGPNFTLDWFLGLQFPWSRHLMLPQTSVSEVTWLAVPLSPNTPTIGLNCDWIAQHMAQFPEP